jgi:hypothetical protein
MTLGFVLMAALVTLGVISYMIKDEEYNEWNNDKNK